MRIVARAVLPVASLFALALCARSSPPPEPRRPTAQEGFVEAGNGVRLYYRMMGGEGDTPGTASGGEGCEAPPVCSGGDAVGCATLQQVWRTRCAEGRNKIEGGGECSADGHPQFVCHGDQVECKQALLLAEEFCAAQKADENGDGQPDWTKPGSGVDMTEGEGEDPEGMGEGPKQVPFGANFDTTGFLTPSSCPQMGSFTFWGRTFDLDNMGVFSLCDFTQMVHAIFLLLGAFVAFKIVGGVNT